MKKIGKLKLNQLSKVEMDKRELSQLQGGLCCGCGCVSGDIYGNQNANAASGYSSPGGNVTCWCWDGSQWVYYGTF